jgi:pSer/pThr/pTyr-binding forkhead associated (FHA) protein
MSELTLTIIRLGFLAVLWLFVLTAVSVMRSDLFGRKARKPVPAAPRARPAAPPPPPKAKPAKPRRGVPSTLVVTGGALTGTSLRLGGAPITLGRAKDSTLVLDDDYVSSRHARIYANNGQWVVEDLGSTNGTYLDRTKVNGPTPVAIGVPIRVGKTVIELRK